MLEKIIVFLLIMFAVGVIAWRIRNVVKGDSACSGCGSDCNCCSSNIPIVIDEEHK